MNEDRAKEVLRLASFPDDYAAAIEAELRQIDEEPCRDDIMPPSLMLEMAHDLARQTKSGTS